MELNEIQKKAQEAAVDMHIDWDRLDIDPEYVHDFERILERSMVLLPDLENIHTKLSQGKSVLFEDDMSSLPYNMREEYLDLIEKELYVGYQLKDLYERFTLIRSITEMA